MNHIIGRYLIALLCLAVSAAGCETSTDPSGTRSVTLSAIGERIESDTLVVIQAADFIQTQGTDTLVLTRVAVVLSEIELERIGAEDCVAATDNNDCEEFELGPLLLELNLNGGIEQFVSAIVPAGMYDEIEFEIDTPDDDEPADSAFVAANPQFEDVSVRVEGTWNGEPFLFVQDIDGSQELDLSPPLEIDGEGEGLNLTLVLDLATWFVRTDGSLLDPRSALEGQVNEALVEANIESSLDILETMTRTGWRTRTSRRPKGSPRPRPELQLPRRLVAFGRKIPSRPVNVKPGRGSVRIDQRSRRMCPRE